MYPSAITLIVHPHNQLIVRTCIVLGNENITGYSIEVIHEAEIVGRCVRVPTLKSNEQRTEEWLCSDVLIITALLGGLKIVRHNMFTSSIEFNLV